MYRWMKIAGLLWIDTDIKIIVIKEIPSQLHVCDLRRDVPMWNRRRHCGLSVYKGRIWIVFSLFVLNNARLLHLGCMCSYKWICLCLFVRDWVCACVLSVDGAFVTKHQRCQRDTVGWRRKGWGQRGGVPALLYCCWNCRSEFEPFILTIILGNLQQASRKNLECTFQQGAEWGG